MRIGIDARTILNPEEGEGAGIGHYTYQLIRHLLTIDRKNAYVLFFDRSVQKRRLAKFKQDNVDIIFFPFAQYARLMPADYSQFLISATLDRERLNVFHSPVFSLPPSYRGNSVITVHDLAAYKFPELYLRREVNRFKRDIPDVLKQVKRIIAVSHSTAKDLKEIFGVDSGKIEVVYQGVDKRFFQKKVSAQISGVKRKYGIKKKYFLFLGTLDSRKNIIRIISAYERFRNEGVKNLEKPKFDPDFKFSEYQLVLAGARGTKFWEIERKISFSKYKRDIILTGYIPPDNLGALFAGADVFIFPSLYEGFGLPVVEAMAGGTPVITSNISSMPEIVNGAAILIDPYNIAGMAQSLYNLSVDTNLRKELSLAGKKQANKFSWEKCARQTLEVYKRAVKLVEI